MNAPVDISEIIIETDRLILRPWRMNDREDLFAYASVPGVGEMAGWPHHTSREDSQRILELFIREKKTLALEWKKTGTVIGSLGLEELSQDPVSEELMGREIGYVLSKEYWGQGIMAEAVGAVADYCFTIWNMDYLTCGHFCSNHQSRRVIEKAGFQYLYPFSYKTSMGTEEQTLLYIRYNSKK